MKLTIFLCTLLVIPLFAEHQINLYPVYDKLKRRTGYALNVNIGKPGKEFRVLLDTLTSLLWVPGTDRVHPFCYDKKFYSKSDSTSCTTTLYTTLAQCYGLRGVNLWSWNDDIMESDKTATLTLGGRNSKSCDLSNEKYEPLYFLGNRYNFEFLAVKMGYTEFVKLGITLTYPNTMDPYITVPDEFMKKIAYDLGAQADIRTGKYLVDCKQSFNPFEIFTAENKFIIEPKNFIIKHNPNDKQCELAFRSFKGFEQEVMLGLPFLHQYCMTVEAREKRVYFAPII
uniref:Bm8487 n=1 Tax=Brugia malayi TaxID=6279 RepID=A0A0H5S2D0_BRUMA|nr:Bm8487 [Brugia malayi]